MQPMLHTLPDGTRIRIRPVEPGAATAEFAIVVGDPLQGQGLGGVLTRALAEAACAVGIRRFSATVLADNMAVQHLMETFAVRLEQRFRHDGVREVVAQLPGCGAAALAA